MSRCADVVYGEHLELGAASAPTAASSVASVKGDSCLNLPNETEKEECSHKNAYAYYPSEHRAHNASKVLLGSSGTHQYVLLVEILSVLVTTNTTIVHCVLHASISHPYIVSTSTYSKLISTMAKCLGRMAMLYKRVYKFIHS